MWKKQNSGWEITKSGIFILDLVIINFFLLYTHIPTSEAFFFKQLKSEANRILAKEDWIAPVTMLQVSASPKRNVEETVLNPGFENDLQNWNSLGNVNIQTSTLDKGESKMAVISPADNESEENAYYSTLSQEIPNTANNLSFWYNFMTYDSYGFDDPGFSVYLNNVQIFQISAEDIANPEHDISSTGWKKYYYNLTHFPKENEKLVLTFKAGNTGFNNLDSWVELDNVSTNDLVVSSTHNLEFDVEDESGVKTYFKKGGCNSTGLVNEYTSAFNLNAATEDNLFCYWSVDDFGNSENKKEIVLIFDDQPLDNIADFTIAEFGQGKYGISWTSVGGIKYVLKYSENEILNENDFVNAQEVLLNAPNLKGEKEIYGLDLGIEGLFFKIKVYDAAGNASIV